MLAEHDLYHWTHASSPLSFMLFFRYGLIQISHTHSWNTEMTDALIVILGVNCFHSIELISTVSKRSHWTSHSFFHCIYCHRINDRFWFEESSTGLLSRYPQWVWKIWECEKLWETAKKLIHEDARNIKRREKYRHTQKHRQAHKHTQEHRQTHTNTHTRTQKPRNPACIQGLAGRAAIATGQAGAAWTLSRFQGLGSHCDLTAKSFMIVQTT
jgi:hypothetical protein